jgi:hypothetical protein
MPRGGRREGAGGKPTWKNGKTKTIRVPVVLADEILRIARELDEEGVIERDTESKVIDLSKITVPEIRGKRFVFLSDLLKIGYEVHPLKWAEIARAELNLSARDRVAESKPPKIPR